MLVQCNASADLAGCRLDSSRDVVRDCCRDEQQTLVDDEAAAALLHMAATRVSRAPTALAVITGTEYGYRRPDGVWVIPLGCLGP